MLLTASQMTRKCSSHDTRGSLQRFALMQKSVKLSAPYPPRLRLHPSPHSLARIVFERLAALNIRARGTRVCARCQLDNPAFANPHACARAHLFSFFLLPLSSLFHGRPAHAQLRWYVCTSWQIITCHTSKQTVGTSPVLKHTRSRVAHTHAHSRENVHTLQH